MSDWLLIIGMIVGSVIAVFSGARIPRKNGEDLVTEGGLVDRWRQPVLFTVGLMIAIMSASAYF